MVFRQTVVVQLDGVQVRTEGFYKVLSPSLRTASSKNWTIWDRSAKPTHALSQTALGHRAGLLRHQSTYTPDFLEPPCLRDQAFLVPLSITEKSKLHWLEHFLLNTFLYIVLYLPFMLLGLQYIPVMIINGFWIKAQEYLRAKSIWSIAIHLANSSYMTSVKYTFITKQLSE